MSELHIFITAKEFPEIWQQKFGTREKPHYKTKCKICGKTYGEHYAVDCECPESSIQNVRNSEQKR